MRSSYYEFATMRCELCFLGHTGSDPRFYTMSRCSQIIKAVVDLHDVVKTHDPRLSAYLKSIPSLHITLAKISIGKESKAT